MAVAHAVAGEHHTEKTQNAQEEAVGIATYVTAETPGFQCIVKQRYTDFIVNEILLNGQVLHLVQDPIEHGRKRKRAGPEDSAPKKQRIDDEQLPDNATLDGEAGKDVSSSNTLPSSVPQPESDATTAAITIKESTQDAVTVAVSDKDKATLQAVFGEDCASSILALHTSVMARPGRKPREYATVLSKPFAEKSKRTEAHICIRRIFSSKLETTTLQDEENRSGPGTIISIKAAPPKPAASTNGGDRRAEAQKRKQDWSDLGGDYLHFSLYKENKDTMEVLSFLASQLKLHVKHFSFAGTKDRRAVTVQRVAVYRIHRERIENFNRIARGFRLAGPWEYKTDPLELGMLSGNEFLLTLRDAEFDGRDPGWSMQKRLQHARECAETAALGLGKHGYLNYYGLQRFGTHSVGTHVVGMKMLQGDLKGAVHAILSYDNALLHDGQSSENGLEGTDDGRRKVPQDDVSRAKAIRDFLEHGDSSDALNRLPGRFTAERGIVTHLGKRDRHTGARPNQSDFQGALMQIQKNLRSMYVHAYQSYVWNTVAGKRRELFGDNVVEGDLVVVGEKERQDGTSNGSATVLEEVDEVGEPIIHPFATAASGTDEALVSAANGDQDDPFVRARPLSRAEAESGRFTIFDLVLPLPGFDVLYPSNEVGEFYKDFMASAVGGGLDPHQMRRAWKDISLPGGYRKLMSRPIGDVKVEVKPYAGVDEQLVDTDLDRLDKSEAKASNVDTASDSAAQQDRIAVILKMQLGSSQYATMALRELTKGGAVAYRPDYSTSNK